MEVSCKLTGKNENQHLGFLHKQKIIETLLSQFCDQFMVIRIYVKDLRIITSDYRGN